MICPEDWRPVDGLVLETNALKAVTATDRNIVVAAGPGAGKTELLAQRADFLLRTGTCPYPRRVLAISFKIDAARNLQDRVRTRSGGLHAARFDSFTFHAFAKRLIDNYRPILTGEDELAADYRIDARHRVRGEQITFDDLVPLALKIVSGSAHALGAVRQTYSHVFLDEVQDATAEQYELVKAAFADSGAFLTAVGDVKQRIMAWAGALDGVMQTFAEDFDATPRPLYQNFRSAPRLRRMQNRMIAVMDPSAVSPDAALAGDAGTIAVRHFPTEDEEACEVAEGVGQWLADGVPPSEIAILVRQQPHLVAERLASELQERGIPFRNEQVRQDLIAEPAAALVFNFIRVVADERQPQAYTELMRVAGRTSATEEAAERFDSELNRLLRDSRDAARHPSSRFHTLEAWEPLVRAFVDLVSIPALVALSPAYRQGGRLDEILDAALVAFGEELAVDGNPTGALTRLSETDSVRILTIHKCKGLEFAKVVVLGLEEQLFWGKPAESLSEFFVAISRAKDSLTLTHVDLRRRPHGAVGRWQERRTVSGSLVAFAEGP